MLKKVLLEKRPNLSNTSVNTYNSTLTNLYKKIYGDEDIDINKFNNASEILETLKDIPVNKRKSILSALVVISDQKQYRDQMLDDIKEYNKETAKQKKTENQIASWVSMDEVKKKFDELKNKADLDYKSKYAFNKQEIQDYIILALMGGLFIPPRRLKDYCDFKVRNFDKDKDNYRHYSKLHFNSYKTAKTYGEQVIKIPPKLVTILKKWENMILDDKFDHKTDYLLTDINGQPLTNVKLNQRLNKIFGKKVSCNQLRHTYLTDKYGDLINKKNELKEDFKMMGSSIAQELVYIKDN